MAPSVAPEAEADLDDIWYYVATDSGSPELADRLLNALTERFLLLARHPYAGHRRGEDMLPGLRSFSVGRYLILYVVEANGDVLIGPVIPGDRNFGQLSP